MCAYGLLPLLTFLKEQYDIIPESTIKSRFFFKKHCSKHNVIAICFIRTHLCRCTICLYSRSSTRE